MKEDSVTEVTLPVSGTNVWWVQPRTIEPAIHSAATQKRDAIHRALLSGLISNVGTKGQKHEYAGPRGSKFSIFPGSALFKAKPDWVMASELVETTKLYARTVARVDPRWIERLAAHLVKRTYSEPFYHRKSARVLAGERVTLYGLVLIPNRNVNYGPIDPATSREIFIHHAFVEGEYNRLHPFLKHNLQLTADVQKMEAKLRRRDLLADARARFNFYAQRLPRDVFDGQRFEQWFGKEKMSNERLLFMTQEDLVNAAAVEHQRETASGGGSGWRELESMVGAYPDSLTLGGREFELRYHYDTGSPRDGVTIVVPVELLSALPGNRLDWLVPGYLQEKIVALLRTLPKPLRTQFVPAPDFARRAAMDLHAADVPLTQALAHWLGKQTGVAVPRDAFRADELPQYLLMNIEVIDAAGKPIKHGRNLSKLRVELGLKARETFSDLPSGEWNRRGITMWDFPDLPDHVNVELNGMTLPAYPGLVDQGETIALRLFEAPEPARVSTRAGLRKLFMLQLKKEIEYLERSLPGFDKAAMYFSPIGPAEMLRKDVVSAAADRAFYDPTDSIRTRADYLERGKDAWARLSAAAREIASYVSETLEWYHAASLKFNRELPALLAPSAADVREQMSHMIYRGFVSRTPHKWLVHLPRYAKAADLRLKKLFNAGAARDSINLGIVRPLWEQYLRRAELHRKHNIFDPELTEYRWMLEEFRVSLFAQELKTAFPISAQRLEMQWQKVRNI